MIVSLLIPKVLRLNPFSEWTVNLYRRQTLPSLAAAGVSRAEGEVVRDSVDTPVEGSPTDVMVNVTSSPSRAKPGCHDSHTPRPLAGNANERLEGGEGSPKKKMKIDDQTIRK